MDFSRTNFFLTAKFLPKKPCIKEVFPAPRLPMTLHRNTLGSCSFGVFLISPGVSLCTVQSNVDRNVRITFKNKNLVDALTIKSAVNVVFSHLIGITEVCENIRSEARVKISSKPRPETKLVSVFKSSSLFKTLLVPCRL